MTAKGEVRKMNERLALLFADGSLVVLPEGTDIGAAWREAEEADWGELSPRTRVAHLAVEMIAVFRQPEHIVSDWTDRPIATA
jgi:hypothetical protein